MAFCTIYKFIEIFFCYFDLFKNGKHNPICIIFSHRDLKPENLLLDDKNNIKVRNNIHTSNQIIISEN